MGLNSADIMYELGKLLVHRCFARSKGNLEDGQKAKAMDLGRALRQVVLSTPESRRLVAGVE